MRSKEYLEHLATNLYTEDIVALLNIIIKGEHHTGDGEHAITVTVCEPGELAYRESRVTEVHEGGKYNINLQAEYLPELEEA